ncbi:hypothetical protein FF1_031612 [Malus domestica]
MSAIRVDSAKPYFATSSLVIGYAFCSSLLAVINKFAITKFNYLGLLTALQYLTSALGVWGLGKSGFLHHNPFTWQTAKTSCTPLSVALADTTFRKQPISSKLTFVSLLIILGGAVGYMATDSGFSSIAY